MKNLTGVHYSITLLVIVGLIMLSAWVFKIVDPTWAIVSGIVCTELNIGQARTTILSRISATLVGAIIAYFILVVVGPGYLAITIGIVLITLLCYYLIPLENIWKLATATGAIILVAGLQQHSVIVAETMALRRTAEVVAGSLLAGLISFGFGYFFKK